MKPCKSLDEFVKKYDKDLERILCKSFRNYINIEELPEVKNDVYAHLLEKNFFGTYDPTKAQFSTYLYTYLFKFLKSKKVKTDKDPATHASCIDTPLFDDSSASLIDIKDFTPDLPTACDTLTEQELEEKIRSTIKGKHHFQVRNPYDSGTLQFKAWEVLSEPKTIEQLEEYVSVRFTPAYDNPYHPKKDEIKHLAWNSFWKGWQTRIPICSETQFWVNIPGVRRVVIEPDKLSEKERSLYHLLFENHLNFMDLLEAGFDGYVIQSLIAKGYVEEKAVKVKRKIEFIYQPIKESYLCFDYARNLAFHMVHLMKEEHPEFVEFNGGFYHLNTKTDVTYRVLQMILNGKTKKQITNTLNIGSSALNEARDSMFRDIRKLIDA